MPKNAATEMTAKQIAFEELTYDAQCERGNGYSVDEDESMPGFDAVGLIDD